MIKITFYGHSNFLIESNKGKVIIDPFFTNNPHTKVTPNEIHADGILVTHGHSDHLGNAVELSKKNGAPIVGVKELVDYCIKQGATGFRMNIGGSHNFEFGEVQLTPALHSSTTEEGIPTGNPCGFILRVENKTIYHAGDTSLSAELSLIGEMNNIDVALLPIGDIYTMGPADAAKAVEFLHPKIVIPMHYNTFPEIEQDPEDFADKVGDLAKVEILKVGKTFEL